MSFNCIGHLLSSSGDPRPPTPNFKLIPQTSLPNYFHCNLYSQTPNGVGRWSLGHPFSIRHHLPGGLGIMAPSVTAICSDRVEHSQTPTHLFLSRRSNDFSGQDRGDWLEMLPFLAFLHPGMWERKRRKLEIAKLTDFGQVQYVFLSNSIFFAKFYKPFLECWAHIWFSGCGKSDNNCCVLCLGH